MSSRYVPGRVVAKTVDGTVYLNKWEIAKVNCKITYDSPLNYGSCNVYFDMIEKTQHFDRTFGYDYIERQKQQTLVFTDKYDYDSFCSQIRS